MTTPTPNDFRELCGELHAAVQLYTGQNPSAANTPPNEIVSRLMDAMSATATALSQPEPEGMTDEGIMRLACTLLGYEYTPSLLSDPENGVGSLDAFPSELLTFARAIQQRSARPTIQPVPSPPPWS
jgi:hypothetical protein